MILNRGTRQKEIISEEIQKLSKSFTAEELHKKLSNKGIGIATVYRFLKSTRRSGKLHAYTCERRTIYSREKMSHSHFICEKCGKTTHLEVDKIDFLKRKIYGEICHFQIEVTGICKKCLEK